MKIVGVGVGPGMLTQEAADAIHQAEIVYGSSRAIELASDCICCEARSIKDYTRIHEMPDNAVVLSTGDPDLSGLGKFAGANDVVIPGISSLQVACARLKIDLAGLVVITAHGREPSHAIATFKWAIASGCTVFLLPAPGFSVEQVAQILVSTGVVVPIAVLERLGYPDERIEVGTTEKPPQIKSDMYCIMVGPADYATENTKMPFIQP